MNANQSNERKWFCSQYSAESIIDADYTDDLVFLASTLVHAQIKSRWCYLLIIWQVSEISKTSSYTSIEIFHLLKSVNI